MKGFGLDLIEQTHLKRVPQFRRIGNVSDNIPNWNQVLDSGTLLEKVDFIGGFLLEKVDFIGDGDRNYNTMRAKCTDSTALAA